MDVSQVENLCLRMQRSRRLWQQISPVSPLALRRYEPQITSEREGGDQVRDGSGDGSGDASGNTDTSGDASGDASGEDDKKKATSDIYGSPQDVNKTPPAAQPHRSSPPSPGHSSFELTAEFTDEPIRYNVRQSDGLSSLKPIGPN